MTVPAEERRPPRVRIIRTADRKRELEAYLDLVVDVKDSGWLHCASFIDGHPRPAPFRWPQHRDRAVDWMLDQDSQGRDVYVAPYILTGTGRDAGTAVRRQLVHADVDDGMFDQAKLDRLGGFAVASGTPGNAHTYVMLDRSVSPEVHKDLCRGLKDYFGATDSKIRDNDLLRPAGTRNHKNPEKPRRVRLLPHAPLVRHDPEKLAARLAAARNASGTQPQIGDTRTHSCSHGDCVRGSSTTQGSRPGFSDDYLRVLDDESETDLYRPDGGSYPSRSEALQGFALHAINRGCTEEEYEAEVMDPRHASSRWRSSARMPDMLSRAWRAAEAMVQARPPVRSKMDAHRRIEALERQAVRPWPGRGGSIQREVLSVFFLMARTLQSINFFLSMRDIASLSGRTPHAVSRAVRQLVAKGWLTKLEDGDRERRLAARYRIGFPHRLVVTGDAPAAHVLGIHDYWSSLPPSVKHIFEELLGQTGTVADLVRRTGLTRQTVTKQLGELEGDGLVCRNARVWSVVTTDLDELDNRLDALAHRYGFTGRLAERDHRMGR